MKRVLLGVMVVSALAGCTTPLERRQAEGSYNYLEQPEPVPLNVPEGLSSPKISSEYLIPAPVSGPRILGERVDVRSPLQVLPLGEGVRLQEGVDSVTVLVENQRDDIDLKAQLFSTLTEFLQHKKIGLASRDEGQGQLDTAWIEVTEEFGGSLWSRDEYKLRQRYRFDVEVRDNGHTGSLTIELLDHEEFIDQRDQDVVLTDSDKRRYTIDMLNNAISYMNFKQTQQNKLDDLERAEGMELALATDADGNTTFETQAGFERVWSRLDRVLPVLGFTVKDLDKSQGTYYVDYDPNQGFWANLWGNNDLLALKSGAYRVKLTEGGLGTQILLQDADGVALDAELMSALYQQFSDYMKRNARSL
ncbi:outer membrane protein assembly factor BamC [Ferrimonas sediminicola]|uniref:Outer membrane protein assembly factor BamC n=1 Tax=Ferrimonas sediminicola TaxID=2569538 RepID=A0A4U1BCN5_9GAMM|nr:outer membrane protein assembly factor BamC [Ferrimonas sediminicola]TKB48265.1 outer membrane protein assembly factor BamC [Ferrimonas sediminicola]